MPNCGPSLVADMSLGAQQKSLADIARLLYG
jgi:hypothetical protein